LDQRVLEELGEEEKRNREDIVRCARWEAEMVKKLGAEWFKTRDEWFWRTFEADAAMHRNSEVREALIRALMRVDELKRRRCAEDPLRCWPESSGAGCSRTGKIKPPQCASHVEGGTRCSTAEEP